MRPLGVDNSVARLEFGNFSGWADADAPAPPSQSAEPVPDAVHAPMLPMPALVQLVAALVVTALTPPLSM